MYKRIYIEITNICNLNCDFCPLTNRKKEYMSVVHFEKILNKIKGYTDNIYLHIKGEPLMHPHLDEILKLCNEYNINVNVTTNGRLLNDKLNIISNRKIRQINISLHSFNNVDEITKLLDTVDKIKNSYISLRLWNNKDNSKIFDLLEHNYNKKIEFNGKRFTLSNNIFLDKDILFSWPDINGDVIEEYGTCLGLKNQLSILVDGSVVTCCLDNEGYNNLGNIYNSDLESIINSKKYQEILKGFNSNKLVSELCKRCGYRMRFNKR